MNKGNKGLTNIGQLCYLNSAIQCLIHLDVLNPKMMNLKKIFVNRKKEYTLLKQWIQLYKEIWDDSNSDIIHIYLDFMEHLFVDVMKKIFILKY